MKNLSIQKNPSDILQESYDTIITNLDIHLINDIEISEKIEFICRNLQNRAGVRLLMSCLLAKIHHPEFDLRKPYTEIGSDDSFSGRTYDEKFITDFINKYELPCNPTTAFLTPALRNRNIVLTLDINLVGRPQKLYKNVLDILDVVHKGIVDSEIMLQEVIRFLVSVKNERLQRFNSLLAGLKANEKERIPLSSEGIITLIQQHLACPNSSRLPVLIVASAYTVAGNYLKEKVLSLQSHNAADLQTGALGDIEITLESDGDIVTSYEMKMKRVLKSDLERALQKLNETKKRVDNYIFITTDTIDSDVIDYAKSLYDLTGGIEFVVLDCIDFIRHFLHLFHRIRMEYLNIYQKFVLDESESSVGFPLKEAFLALRQAAESINE